MTYVATGENATRAGIEISILRRWAKEPKKSRIGAILLRKEVISKVEYLSLEDGRNHFWNNSELVNVFCKTGLDINGLAYAIGTSNETMKRYSRGIHNEKVSQRIKQLMAANGI